jgi:hypothetical protein
MLRVEDYAERLDKVVENLHELLNKALEMQQELLRASNAQKPDKYESTPSYIR